MDRENSSDISLMIEILRKENLSLRIWQDEASKLMQKMLEKVEQNEQQISSVQQVAYINRIRIDSMPYELRDPDYKSPVFIPNIETPSETRHEIIVQKKSIGRFGEKEFDIIAGVGRWNSQSASEVLAEKLINVLHCSDSGFIIGLNRNFYGNLEEIDESIANDVRAYMRPDVRRLHARLIDKNKVYGHTLMNDITSEESLSEVREIWNDKECVFIEGEHTGMGVGNDLFDNCRSIERIICSSESAIDRYDDIMAATLRHSKGKLILLALGPTATALAYDIFKEGYQAVDIGHIDLYYEKYIRDLAKLQDVSIPYKYSNCDEVGQRHQIEPITDQMYLSQIVDRIC